jgi:lia operon protein LiaG
MHAQLPMTRFAFVMILAAATVMPAAAQQTERYVLVGANVAVYNLAGEVRIEGGDGPEVVVELTRGGADASELEVDVGEIRGWQSLRVIYPSDRIVYPRAGIFASTDMRVRADGTFGRIAMPGAEDQRGETMAFARERGRRVRISGRGGGMEAYADMRVLVPQGQRIAVFLGVGRATVSNVDGELLVDVASASIAASGARGWLRLDTGSGSIEVRGAEGEVILDTGSGRIEAADVRGTRLVMDTGSGRVEARGIAVDALNVDTGSGNVALADVSARVIRVDTGSGSVRLGLLSDVDELEIDTGAGSVTLSVPETLGADLTIDTGSGRITVDIPVQVREMRRNRFRGTIGDGAGRIEIDTGSGGVRVIRESGGRPSA